MVRTEIATPSRQRETRRRQPVGPSVKLECYKLLDIPRGLLISCSRAKVEPPLLNVRPSVRLGELLTSPDLEELSAKRMVRLHGGIPSSVRSRAVCLSVCLLSHLIVVFFLRHRSLAITIYETCSLLESVNFGLRLQIYVYLSTYFSSCFYSGTK